MRKPHTKNQKLSIERCEPRHLLAAVVEVGDLGSGIAVADDATGTGYVLFSEQDVQTRFGGASSDNAAHLVAVRFSEGAWQVNNDSEWSVFDPVATDTLLANVDFDADVVRNFENTISDGTVRPVGGVDAGYIDVGYADGDLHFFANRWNGGHDDGEIGATGSYFSKLECEPSVPDSAENLETLALAALNYESFHRYFPTDAIYGDDGQALLSWRVAVLPYLGHGELYERFDLDEPWDSPHNIELLPEMPSVYAHSQVVAPQTNYLAFVGEDTIFSPPTDLSRANRGTSIGNIRDGTSNTVLIAEANPSSAVEWTKPQDIDFDVNNPLNGLTELESSQFNVVMANAKVVAVPDAVSPAEMHEAVARSDGKSSNVLDPHRSATVNLRELTIAALNHESAVARFPAQAIYSGNGEPLLSWRVSILPYIEHGGLYEQFRLDEPWDSPHNLALISQMPNVFAHPQVAGYRTNYLALAGVGTAFPAGERGQRLSAFRDGLPQTVLFVEADVDQAVEWTRPNDIAFGSADPLAGLGNIVEAGFHVGFADGSVRLVPGGIAADQVAAIALLDDAASLPVDRLMGDVNLDGRVDTMDFDVIRRNLFQPPVLVHTWQTGDLNGDRVVGPADSKLWVTGHFQAARENVRPARTPRAALARRAAPVASAVPMISEGTLATATPNRSSLIQVARRSGEVGTFDTERVAIIDAVFARRVR